MKRDGKPGHDDDGDQKDSSGGNGEWDTLDGSNHDQGKNRQQPYDEPGENNGDDNPAWQYGHYTQVSRYRIYILVQPAVRGSFIAQTTR